MALDQHPTAFAVVADPADDAAPGDVLAVERLEIDRAPILHVNDLGLLPGRGEEQSEDEGKTGHDVPAPARARGCCAFSEEANKRLRPDRLHEPDPDHVTRFPGDLARPAGGRPV